MAAIPPPPPTLTAPPPPLPPPSLPPPPLPLPVTNKAPKHHHHKHHQQLPPSNVVLLQNVPLFLHGCLREWILPCGPARTILWYPKQSGDLDDDYEGDIMALVTMMHGDGAWKLVSIVEEFHKNDDKNNGEANSEKKKNKMRAFLVPASPDIPLPPTDIPEDTKKSLIGVMKQRLQEFQSTGGKLPELPVETLDTQKVAAAAGGNNYDEDADPLNAPAVLRAVKEFRKSLEKTSSVQQKRRMALVQDKLEQAKQSLKGNANGNSGGGALPIGLPPMPANQGDLPPPPFPSTQTPGGGPPLPPPPPPTVTGRPAGTGERGISNLPAWMTQQQQTQPPPPLPTQQLPPPPSHDNPSSAATAATGPPAKKARRSLEEGKAELRAFIATQIKQLLGEEEETLINFILSHAVVERKPMSGLLEELRGVLEEDADGFVRALQTKMEEYL